MLCDCGHFFVFNVASNFTVGFWALNCLGASVFLVKIVLTNFLSRKTEIIWCLVFHDTLCTSSVMDYNLLFFTVCLKFN